MTTNTGTITSYDQVGLKEDISDIITNISPTKTPFQTSIGNETVWNTLFQWQEDSLQAVGTNAQLEGFTAPSAVSQETVMRSNNTQIFAKVASASGTTDAVKAYGRGKELAYQLAMRSAEIKRDLENAFIGVTTGSVAGSSTTARQTGSAASMIDATVTFTNGTGGGLNFVGTTPAAAVITETAVLDVLQQLYTDGAEPNTIMVKPADALNVAAFQGNNRTRFVDNGDRSVVNAVDFYDSPFGKIKVTLNRFIVPTDSLIIDPAMWKKAVLRNWFRETLAKTGDATTVQIVGEFGLKHRNFKASGRITNLA